MKREILLTSVIVMMILQASGFPQKGGADLSGLTDFQGKWIFDKDRSTSKSEGCTEWIIAVIEAKIDILKQCTESGKSVTREINLYADGNAKDGVRSTWNGKSLVSKQASEITSLMPRYITETFTLSKDSKKLTVETVEIAAGFLEGRGKIPTKLVFDRAL